MPDLAALTQFAKNRRHNLTGPVTHQKAGQLARFWIPHFFFHEEERFHPIDVQAMLAIPPEVFQTLSDAEKEQFRIINDTVVNGQHVIEEFDPPLVREPVIDANLVLGSGTAARDALSDPRLDGNGVYTHGHRLEASLKFFGADQPVKPAEALGPGNPRRPRHPIVIRAELRMLFETLKHELELDDLPEGLEKPIDAIWTDFAVEESFFRVTQGSPIGFRRTEQRAVLRELVAAQAIGDPAARQEAERQALAKIPANWEFVPVAWTAVRNFAFMQFHLVYAFNDYKEYGTWPFDNEHEGDVEGCCVVFRRSALEDFAAGRITVNQCIPHTIMTSAHEEFNDADELKRLPDDLDAAKSELRVFVAPGSHASYLTPGPHDILDFEDIFTDLPGEAPTWLVILLGLSGLLVPALLIVALIEHLVDSEDETSDAGVTVGPGQKDEANLKFDKRIEVTPLSAFQGGTNIYQPARRALLALRGYPGKWGADAGFKDKSSPWKNKTDRYFRRFLAGGQVADPIL